jgi:hypothetical protein
VVVGVDMLVNVDGFLVAVYWPRCVFVVILSGTFQAPASFFQVKGV